MHIFHKGQFFCYDFFKCRCLLLSSAFLTIVYRHSSAVADWIIINVALLWHRDLHLLCRPLISILHPIILQTNTDTWFQYSSLLRIIEAYRFLLPTYSINWLFLLTLSSLTFEHGIYATDHRLALDYSKSMQIFPITNQRRYFLKQP